LRCVVLAWLLIAGPAFAAGLPVAVDGQPLPSLAPMLEQVTPAVVNVYTASRVQVRRSPLLDDPFFRQFFGIPDMPREQVERSLGSGVIVDAEKGYVLTNHHVIAAADDISVNLADGRTLTAERVGADPATDIAVVRIPPEQLTALALADSDPLRVGDFVVAVGNPFGLGQTVTSGIVSALGRGGLQGVGVQNFIQTDASINPGNSGGALVNLRGELIGINTAIYSRSGESAGIGFAIPAALVRQVMQQLIEHGEVRRGSLGIQAQDLDANLARALDEPVGSGVVVTQVDPDGAAAQAGIQVGDVLTRVDGQPVGSIRALAGVATLLPVDRVVAIELRRDGRSRQVSVRLDANASELLGENLDPRLAGALFTALPDRLERAGVSGVLIATITGNGRAARAGLRRGDVVLSINDVKVADLPALRREIGKQPERLQLTILRGNRLYAVVAE